jgi:hypothetical protein
VNFSSANIPAISFVITALICRRAATKRNQASDFTAPDDAFSPGQSRIKEKAQFIPSL